MTGGGALVGFSSEGKSSDIVPLGKARRLGANFIRSFESKRTAGDTHSRTYLSMIHLIHFPFASIGGLASAEIGIILGICGLGVGLVFGLSGMYFHHRRQELWHQTARIALEKGQPLPTLPDDEPARSDRDDRRASDARGPARDFRTGLILVGTGIGLYFLVGLGVAAIVGCIGLALLLYALCATIFFRKNPPQDQSSSS
jgi:hypothetical protein